MGNKRYLLKDKNGSATFLDALISIGISIAIFIVFIFYTNALYTIQDEPGVDLEVKSIGLMETLINSPGQTNSHYPEWQEEERFEILKALGLGTSQTIQYGTLRITDNNKSIIYDGPYSNGNPIGFDNTCFLEGTQIVMTDESYKNIEDIKVGDLVKSYDEKSNEIEDKQVTHVFHHTPDEMCDYYLIINNQLRVTPNHRFYVEGDWMFANELSIGDNLFYPSTDYTVFSIENIFERTYTYNFEVEGNHNYFVAMEPTNVLVHNDGLSINVTIEPHNGSVPCKIWFNCSVDNGTEPYTYEWDFGDGETFEETNSSNETIFNHTYTKKGSYDAVLVVTDDDGNTGNFTVEDIPIYEGPIAAFTWFDADGPYSPGKYIYFNSSLSRYSDNDGPPTFEWYDDDTLIPGEDDSVLYHDLGDEEIHSIELKLIDCYGNSDSHEEQVQANSLTPIVLDYKPWVLAGKEVYPDSDNDTFQSYSADYYVRYTFPADAPQGFGIFEVKERTNSQQPIIDIQKIKYLVYGPFNQLYSDIKSALGLESKRVQYNFNIKITINNESGPDNELFFGAFDNDVNAKASTSRHVLIYYPPKGKRDDFSVAKYLIGTHPKYKQAEITISLFIGGTPPDYIP